jgi:hypothetical protein
VGEGWSVENVDEDVVVKNLDSDISFIESVIISSYKRNYPFLKFKVCEVQEEAHRR